MIKLLEYITRKITGNKKINIEEQDSGDLKIYIIKAPKEVMGLLIGKGGKTIHAIRSLARVRAIVDKERIAVQLEEIE